MLEVLPDLVTLEALVDASHAGILQIPAWFVEREASGRKQEFLLGHEE